MGRAVTGRARDCACKTVRHEHGTYRAYKTDGCRCDLCRAANTAVSSPHKREYRRTKAQRRWNGGTIWTSPIGSLRRLEALYAVGWSQHALAQYLGVHKSAVSLLALKPRDRMYVTTATRIKAMYDDLWDKQPTGVLVERSRRYAARMGYAPPLAWDDDELDNPDAKPYLGARGRGCQRDRYLELLGLGCTRSEIALKYNVTVEAVDATLRRAEKAAA